MTELLTDAEIAEGERLLDAANVETAGKAHYYGAQKEFDAWVRDHDDKLIATIRALQQERNTERAAAGHWMREAINAHNEACKLADKQIHSNSS